MDANKISRDAMCAIGFQAAVSLSAEIQYIIECKRNGYAKDYPDTHNANIQHFWTLAQNLIDQGIDEHWIRQLMKTHKRRI